MCSGCGFAFFGAKPLFTAELIFDFKREMLENNPTVQKTIKRDVSMKLYVLDSILVLCEPEFFNVNLHGIIALNKNFDYGVGWLLYLSKWYSQDTLTK